MDGTALAIELPRAEGWSAEEVLNWGFEQFGRGIAIASAFGVEGMVLIDLASQLRQDFRVFTLDTGFFFPETYALIDQVERRYGVTVERCRPVLTPTEQARSLGEALWSRDPQRCCELRKIDPLRKILSELEAWATAIRRDQTDARARTSKVEWDSRFGLAKINPLADWTWQQVWEYVRAKRVPYNPLHDRNYPSIGCTHCTRAVAPGEDLRAGRWPGFQKTECGLHSEAFVPASA